MSVILYALTCVRSCKIFLLLSIFLFSIQFAFAQPDTIKYTGTATICVSGSKVLTTDPAGTNYQWQRNGTNTVNTPSYTVTNPGIITVTVDGRAFPPLTLTAATNPVANFTFSPNSQCSSVPVNFTNTSTGNGPLTYSWNFGDPNSGTNNTSTDLDPIHRFVGSPAVGNQNFSVTLTVTSADGCTSVKTQSVNILKPSTLLGGDGSLVYTDGFTYFTQCNPTPSLFTFSNQSSSVATNLSYKIIWGDNSPDFNATVFSTITHTYGVGVYSLQFIVNGGNGCKDTGNYRVFVGSNPGVGLQTPGNTNICTNSQLTFNVTGTSGNPIGTLYTVSFNDPNNITTYQHPVPDSISHIFLINSCGYTSPGSNGSNSFYAKIVAANPCGVSEGTVLPIHVSQKPTAGIAISPRDTVCVNNPVTLGNTSPTISNVSTTGNCTTGAVVWKISPATGWTVTSGTLGNDFNSNSVSIWAAGSNNPIINFNTPGNYTIKLKVGGNSLCGLDSITKTICVNPALIGNFTLDQTSGCAPFNVAATNTSNTPNCGSNTYAWTVTYASTTGCTPNTIGYTYVGGTSATSANPQFQFTNPGVYTISLVTKSSGGACTAATVSKTVTVKAKPVVNIVAPATTCQNLPVNPSAPVSCYTTGATYVWTFTGGSPSSSTSPSPGTITYATPGTYLIDLSVTNECGTTSVSKQIIVNQIPDVTVPANKSFCKGVATGALAFSSTLAGTTFTWTNNNTAIGLVASGTGNIASFTAANNTANPITATITVTPVNGCNGTPATFTITVNPIPLSPVVSTPVNYCQNEPAIPLTATALANHTLNWYTAASGGTASSTAPTPSNTTAGTTTYYVSQTNAGGCESQRAAISVTVNPSFVIGNATVTNPTSCASATGSITITGLTPSVSYTVTYTKNGAPVTATISSNASGNLTIPGLTSGTYDNIKVARSGCPSNVIGPYSLSDPNPPATPTASGNGPLCSGSTLSLTANGVAGATYTWSGPNNFSSSAQNPTIPNTTIAASGTYSVTVTVNGCTSSAATVPVVINQTPLNITSSSNTPLCSGDTIRLLANSASSGSITYAWTGPNTFLSTDQNPTIPNATPTMSGTYIVTATLGTCSAAPRSITVVVNPTPVITDSSFVSPSSCTSASGSISLMGLASNTSYTINYLKNGTPITVTLSSNSSGVVTIFGLSAGTYTNVGVTALGCSSNKVGPFVLVAPNPPNTPTVSSNSPLCAGTSLNLNATTTTPGNVTYNWTGPNGYSSTIQNPVINNATVAASGTYTVTATINGCVSSPATVSVVVSPNASLANAGPDQQLCNQSSSVLAANSAGVGTGTWTVIAPSTATITQVNNSTSAINNLPLGITKAVWTINNSVCQSTSDTVQILNAEGLTNHVTPLSNTICSGQSFTINGSVVTGGSGNYVYQWQQSTNNITFSNVSGATSANITVTPSANTYYRRLVTSGPCTGYSDTAVITVLAGISSNTITGNQTICINTVPSILAGASPIGGGGSFTYSWEQSTDNGVTWIVINGAASQDYQPNALAVSTRFRRKVNTSLCGGAQSSVSNVITIDLNPDAKAEFSPTQVENCVPFNITPSIINLTPYNNAVSTYNWYVNGVLIGSGQTFPGYTMTNAGDSITIKLVAISRYGCKNDSTQRGFKTIARPTPAFIQSDSVGCGPLSITFTNQTPNAAQYTYLWDFGTGQTSTLQQPTAINFPVNPQSGDTVYTVKFRTISQCDTITLLRYVRVKSKPKALFAPDRTNGCSSYNFTFTNTSRGNGNIYVWDFGDGSPTLATNAAQVQHIYHTGNIDTFNIKLKATNECGTDSLVYKLVVQPITIRPDFAINGNERYGCVQHTVRFFNTSQGGSTFRWYFGDGDSLITNRNVDTIIHTYMVAGTYTVRMRAINSCSDTTDIELVTVYPKPTVSFTANPLVACFGDTIRFLNASDTGLVYNWRFGDGSTSLLANPNKIYNTGGTYRVWLKGTEAYPTGVGCSDSAYKDVVIRDTLVGSFTASDTVAGCTPAAITLKNNNRPAALTTWMFGDGSTANGDSVIHNYLLPGTYTVRMISKGIAGCTYAASKTIVVTSPNGTLQYAGGYLCPGIPLRMEVTANAATQQIRYIFGDGDSLTTTNSVVFHNYLQPGVYVPYAYAIAGNCRAKLVVGDTLKVDRLRTGFRTQQQQQCGFTTVTFTDTSYAFFGIQSRRYDFGDGTFSTSQNPVHNYTTSSTYNVRLRIVSNSGCADTVTIPLTVSVRNYPVSTISGDSLACVGQSLPLAALVQSTDAIASYNWTFGNNTSATGAMVTALYNQAGVYTITLISRTAFGCADTVRKIIRVNASPQVNAGPDVRICKGQSIQLSAIGAATWQWTPLQNLSCTTCPNPIANPLFTTSYIVTGSNNALCKVSDTVVVEVVQPFTMAVAPTATICIGDSVQLFATGAYTYAWNPPVSLNNAAISNPIAKPNITTVYQVVGKDRYNCFTDTDYVRVNVGQYPTVDLGNGGVVTAGTTINMNPVITNGPITRYTWTPATDLSCSNCPRPTAVINKDISYKLEVQNSFGCTGSDTINFRVNCDPNQLYIPNAFSPDGDGTNDVLMVRGKGIATVKYFRIYNRWGQLVFERSNVNPNDPQQGWNGKINGTAAQPDVYVYTAEAVCTGGATFVYKGNVTLVR